jgi:hypothetical protein
MFTPCSPLWLQEMGNLTFHRWAAIGDAFGRRLRSDCIRPLHFPSSSAFASGGVDSPGALAGFHLLSDFWPVLVSIHSSDSRPRARNTIVIPQMAYLSGSWLARWCTHRVSALTAPRLLPAWSRGETFDYVIEFRGRLFAATGTRRPSKLPKSPPELMDPVQRSRLLNRSILSMNLALKVKPRFTSLRQLASLLSDQS